MEPSALDDVRVLDLTQAISGPYCTKLLADFGADVIKVERPGSGDPARRAGPFAGDRPYGERSGLFLHLNTNKRGITLNLKSGTGRAIARALARGADLVVESHPPGRLADWGLGYEELRALNPRLVYVSVTNFGQTGPYRGDRSNEIVAYGIGGEMFSTGLLERYPLKLAGNILHYQAGNVVTAAALGALAKAEQDGVGQHVDMAIMEAALGSVDRRLTALMDAQYTGLRVERETPRAGILPTGLFPTRDGWIQCIVNLRWFDRLCHLLGDPEELQDPRFRDPAHLFDPDLKAIIDVLFWSWLAEHTTQEAMELGQAANLAITAVNTIDAVMNDRHFRARGYWTEVEHPAAGAVCQTGAPYRMPRTPWRIARPAPLLGQHNLEILGGELGFSRQDLVGMRQEGIL